MPFSHFLQAAGDTNPMELLGEAEGQVLLIRPTEVLLKLVNPGMP